MGRHCSELNEQSIVSLVFFSFVQILKQGQIFSFIVFYQTTPIKQLLYFCVYYCELVIQKCAILTTAESQD